MPDRKFELIKIITSSENKEGNKIKFVLISDTASEGIDFKNIRQVHILNPGYNMSRIEQTIGRAVRTCSHKELDFKKRNVEIYLHCASTKEEGETSDTKMYKKAMGKAKKVGEFTRILKENSVDCLINKEDNDIRFSNLEVEQELSKRKSDGTFQQVKIKVGSLPYSMDCDFMDKCRRVECKYGKDKDESGINVDDSTFNESFIFMNNNEIIRIISVLYLERTFYSFEQLTAEINRNHSFSKEQIQSALSEMINKRFKHSLFNRLSDETGFLLNIGNYYMFQPLKLTYPKASVYERRTKVPKRHSSLLTSTFTGTNKIIKSLVDNYNKEMIQRFLFSKKGSSSIDNLIVDLEKVYSSNGKEGKERIDFLRECQKAKEYFDTFENLIREVIHGESTEKMGGKKKRNPKKRRKSSKRE